jgi:hypothetical protein
VLFAISNSLLLLSCCQSAIADTSAARPMIVAAASTTLFSQQWLWYAGGGGGTGLGRGIGLGIGLRGLIATGGIGFLPLLRLSNFLSGLPGRALSNFIFGALFSFFFTLFSTLGLAFLFSFAIICAGMSIAPIITAIIIIFFMVVSFSVKFFLISLSLIVVA